MESKSFCHIAPVKYLQFVKNRPIHLTLAHLVESSPEYVRWYVKEKRANNNMINIMDNSAFEMYKQGKDMYPTEKLIEMGHRIQADYIAMSDYPNEPSDRTKQAAADVAFDIHQAGFGTFFIPQSKIRDIEDLIECFFWGLAHYHLIDYIGFSILAIPNAFGVEKGNKLQRMLSRWKFLSILEDRGFFEAWLDLLPKHRPKLHLLGMTDGPNEIQLLSRWLHYFSSWDSSAAIWCGCNGIEFDNSPTGLVHGKYEVEVDFEWDHDSRTLNDSVVYNNIKHIDNLVQKYGK